MTTSKEAALSLIDKIAKANGILVVYIPNEAFKKPEQLGPFPAPVPPIYWVQVAMQSKLISVN